MQTSNKWQLILASASPRRFELLGYTGVTFKVQVSAISECSDETNPALFALDIARQKGQAIKAVTNISDVVVVSADTVVALAGKIYGKPSTIPQAREFLIELAGKTHQVHTAVSINYVLDSQWYELTHVETTEVTFLPLNQELMERYLSSVDSLDKAGGYGIQGQALTMIAGIKGCYANVVGFPLARFCGMMEGQFMSHVGKRGSWQSLF